MFYVNAFSGLPASPWLRPGDLHFSYLDIINAGMDCMFLSCDEARDTVWVRPRGSELASALTMLDSSFWKPELILVITIETP